MIGRGQVVTDHAGPAADVAAAAEALANAVVRPDDLIQLSCQISADGLVMVTIHGDLDVATADRAVRYVTDVIDRYDGPVYADLSEVAFCDACGLGALIRVNTYAGQMGRKLELTSPSRAVTKIMRLTGVHDWLLQRTLAGVSSGEPAPAAQRG
jgi:anti-sigma B factor antagonist